MPKNPRKEEFLQRRAEHLHSLQMDRIEKSTLKTGSAGFPDINEVRRVNAIIDDSDQREIVEQAHNLHPYATALGATRLAGMDRIIAGLERNHSPVLDGFSHLRPEDMNTDARLVISPPAAGATNNLLHSEVPQRLVASVEASGLQRNKDLPRKLQLTSQQEENDRNLKNSSTGIKYGGSNRRRIRDVERPTRTGDLQSEVPQRLVASVEASGLQRNKDLPRKLQLTSQQEENDRNLKTSSTGITYVRSDKRRVRDVECPTRTGDLQSTEKVAVTDGGLSKKFMAAVASRHAARRSVEGGEELKDLLDKAAVLFSEVLLFKLAAECCEEIADRCVECKAFDKAIFYLEKALLYYSRETAMFSLDYKGAVRGGEQILTCVKGIRKCIRMYWGEVAA